MKKYRFEMTNAKGTIGKCLDIPDTSNIGNMEWVAQQIAEVNEGDVEVFDIETGECVHTYKCYTKLNNLVNIKR